MPEFRRDPVSGRWAIIAPERGKRPTDFLLPEENTEEGRCPLCPGSEDLTPPEVLALGRPEEAPPNSPGWKVRVVPNKYPALIPGEIEEEETGGLYERFPGAGVHEVIVETPEHGKPLVRFSPNELALVFEAYRLRLVELARDGRWRYVLIFKNRGARAGASLSHDHSQLVALPLIPELVKIELERSRIYHERNGECLFCKLVKSEQNGPRWICENERFLAFMAYAPRQPLETWIMPKKHRSDFLDHFDENLEALCDIFLRVFGKLEAVLPGLPYNFVLHTAPLGSAPLPYYHWHFEIIPCLTRVAGFEWGTGAYIVPLLPEEAAAFLRDISP